MTISRLDKALSTLYDYNQVHHDLHRLTTRLTIAWRSTGPCCAIWRICFGKPKDQTLENVAKVYAGIINQADDKTLSDKKLETLQGAYKVLLDLTKECGKLDVSLELAAASRKIESAIRAQDGNTVLTIQRELHGTTNLIVQQPTDYQDDVGLSGMF